MLHTDDSLFCIEYWINHLQHITKSVYIYIHVHQLYMCMYSCQYLSYCMYTWQPVSFYHFLRVQIPKTSRRSLSKSNSLATAGALMNDPGVGRTLAKIHGSVIGENDCDGNFGYDIKTTMKIPVRWLTSVPILWGEVTQVTIRIAFIYLSGSPRRTVFCCLHITFLLRVFEDSQKWGGSFFSETLWHSIILVG